MHPDRTRGSVIQTARLRGEPIRARHLEDLQLIFGDPEVTRTLGGLRRPKAIRQTFERFEKHWEEQGYGPWFFADDAGEFVGYAGILHTEVDGLAGIELVYALTPRNWSQGLASEMAESVVVQAFDRLGVEELLCFTLTTNKASQRVMEKAGFRYLRHITHATLPHVLYRLSAEEWRDHTPRGSQQE